MALISEPAPNIPTPPDRLKWRLVRLASVRAICASAFHETADECMIRGRVPWPRGSFNPTIARNNLEEETDYVAAKAAARFKIEERRNFHPNYPESV